MEAERPKMAAVRIIHQKRDAPAVAEGRHPSNIGQPPGVIRACNIYGTYIVVCFQLFVQVFHCQPAAKAVAKFRPQPDRLQPQQNSGIHRTAMGVARHQDPSACPAAGEKQHGLDTQGAPSRAVEGIARSEGLGAKALRRFDRIPTVVQAAGIGQLGQVERRRTAGLQAPLVPGRMERGRPTGGMPPQRVEKRDHLRLRHNHAGSGR